MGKLRATPTLAFHGAIDNCSTRSSVLVRCNGSVLKPGIVSYRCALTGDCRPAAKLSYNTAMADTATLRLLDCDGRILFAARFARMFAYGLLSVILVLYLAELGFSPARIGWLLSLALAGDTAITLTLTTNADRFGRRRMLLAGAVLMLTTGGVFASTDAYSVLLAAAIIGVISPNGSEVGPFVSIEQAALSQLTLESRRTSVFAWYVLTGSAATALGAIAGGFLTSHARALGFMGVAAYRPAIWAYSGLAFVLALLLGQLSPAIEPPIVAATVGGVHASVGKWTKMLGLHSHHSRRVIIKLSAFFAIDSFAGGFILQSVLAYWLHVRFEFDEAALGVIFLSANLLAAASSLTAGWLANRIGLIETMVFTHLPSNILLILVPLMPSREWAVGVLLLRYSLSQMDVPTRQAYVISVVEADERSAAAGVTGVARSLGAMISPMLATTLIATPALFNAPFFLAGGIKIVYDLLVFRAFARQSTRLKH